MTAKLQAKKGRIEYKKGFSLQIAMRFLSM